MAEEQTNPGDSGYKVEVSFPDTQQGPDAPAVEAASPAPEQQPAQQQPAQQPIEEAPIDLDADPFGTTMGEGEQVAGGLGSLIKSFLKGSAKAAGPGAKEAADEVPPTSAGGPLSTKVEPPPSEGQVMPEVQLGTTRPLANPEYFNDPGTQEVLQRLQTHGRTPAPQGWAETEAGAAQIKDITDVMGKPPSLQWSPEELLKLRQVADGQAKSVKTLADELNEILKAGGEPGSEAMAEFEMRSAALIGTQNAIAGLATQAGRILNSLQIRVDSPAAVNRQVADIVRQRGGPATIGERIKAVAEGANPHKDVQTSWMSKTWNEALKWRYNVMLSSIRTHMANISGNTMSSVYEGALDVGTVVNNRLLIRPGTAVLAKLGLGAKVQEALPWASLNTRLAGNYKGTIDGLILAGRIAANDPAMSDVTGGIGKWMNEMGVRVRKGEEGLFGDSSNAGVRKAGVALSTPTRMLEAEDAFFRSVNYWGRLNTLAMDRAAIEAGGDLKVRAGLHAQYVDSPPEDMMLAARDYAAKLTFTSNPDIYGNLISALATMGKRVSNHPVGNLILPFVNTPANLTGYVLEQMGAGMITRPTQTMKDLLGQGTAREQAEAFARVEAAVGLPFLLYPMWESGMFTGVGSTNWSVNQTMESKGWKPASLKVGDSFYSLNRLDPMGQMLAMYATAFELTKESTMSGAGNVALAGFAAVMATADVLQERTFLSSLVKFLDSINQGKGGVKPMLDLSASTVSSFVVPGLVRDMRMANDPTSRSLQVDYTAQQGLGNTLWDRFTNVLANGYPASSQNLPPRIDWKGDVITNEGGAFWRAMMPIPVGTVKEDDPTSYLLVNGVTARKPSHKLTLPGTGGRIQINLFDLDPDGHIYAKYQQVVGQERFKAVAAITASAPFKEQMRIGNAGPDTEAGRGLQLALSRAKSAGDARILQWMMKGGGQLTLAGISREFNLDALPDFEVMRDAIVQYLQTGEKTEMPGVTYKSKAQHWLPKALEPSSMQEQKPGVRF